MTQVKVKMLVLMQRPEGTFHPGDDFTTDGISARALVDSKQAVYVETPKDETAALAFDKETRSVKRKEVTK